MHVVYGSWFPWRQQSLLYFGIGGPRLFSRIAATTILKHFVKLGILVYLRRLQKIWSKNDSNTIKLYYLPILWKGLEGRRVKSKIFRKSSSNFPFGQGCCLISDFARLNSNKVVLLQISLRFEKVIFNNNSTFCVTGFLEPVMSSFRSIPWEAGWFLLGETLNVQACSSPYIKKSTGKS